MRAHDASVTHIPALLEEAIAAMALQAGQCAIDCTFGGGGYAQCMLEAIASSGRLLCLDRDPEVIAHAQELDWVRGAGERVMLVHGSFSELESIVQRLRFPAPHAIVADLGLSSLQLAAPHRGFSFQHAGPLDMRCDPTGSAMTAAALVASASAASLERIIRTYGEDRHARRIAGVIVERRRRQPIMTTDDLATLIASVVPRRGRGIHPATRTFQALRIAVNDELGELERAVPQMLRTVAPGGRVAIVTFHSLEDRIVKNAFRRAVMAGGGTLITKKPIMPSRAEVQRNPRSRSAKLRVFARST